MKNLLKLHEKLVIFPLKYQILMGFGFIVIARIYISNNLTKIKTFKYILYKGPFYGIKCLFEIDK